jgi:hypothetical protein
MTANLNQLASTTALQSVAGFAIGTLVDNVFPAPGAINGASALKEAAIGLGQLIMDSLLTVAYFDYASRAGYSGADGTRSFSFMFTMYATQPNLYRRIAGLSQYLSSTFADGVAGVSSSPAMTISGFKDNTSPMTAQLNPTQGGGDTEDFPEEL